MKGEKLNETENKSESEREKVSIRQQTKSIFGNIVAATAARDGYLGSTEEEIQHFYQITCLLYDVVDNDDDKKGEFK